MMKHFANAAKILIAMEMGLMFVFLTTRPAMDIVLICIAQYALFLPVDASILITNLKKAVEIKVPKAGS